MSHDDHRSNTDAQSISIDSLESLIINGVEQWIRIQTNDATQPILLIVHGGPGYAMMPLFHQCNAVLEDHFIVVNWDQRGAGRSYSPEIPKSSMTFQQLLDDLNSLTQYLKLRFERDSIFLLGHSWGTMLGLTAAKAYPDNYQAFVSIGQVVSTVANEITMYEWELQTVMELPKNSTNRKKALQQLAAIGHPGTEAKYPDNRLTGVNPLEITEHWMGYFGGDLHGKRGCEAIDNWLLRQPVYSGKWGRKWRAGVKFSSIIWTDPAAWNLDFRQSVTNLDIPVFFLQGRHDYDTPATLIEKYVPQLSAPIKQLVWFEASAHFPFFEESELFNQTMINMVKESVNS